MESCIAVVVGEVEAAHDDVEVLCAVIDVLMNSWNGM